MPSAVKFHKFSLNLGKGNFDFSSDALKVALTNTAPTAATNESIGDITQISAGFGYSSGGAAVPDVQWTQTSGTATLTADFVTFTASGGPIATFRYVALYDSVTGFLIAYWDYGTAVNITDGNTFTVNYNNDPTDGTILTV